MNLNRIQLLTGIVFLSSLLIRAQVRDQSHLESIIDTKLQKHIRLFPPQTEVALGMICGGKVTFKGIRMGIERLEAIENSESVFEIGSVTKVFTSALLAHEVLDGRLHLDDRIDLHLQKPLAGDTKITFLQLANHTSGLPRSPSNYDLSKIPENPYRDFSEQLLEDYLFKHIDLDPDHSPSYAYSNLGMGILGYVLSRLEDAPYEQLLQTKIFSPYHMERSVLDAGRVERFMVEGRDLYGQPTRHWELSALAGAGAILSTVNDLTKFMQAHFDPDQKALALTREPTYTLDHISDVGLGWEIIKRRSGDTWYKHSGRTGGYTAIMIMDVAQKNGIVILSNVSGYHPRHGTIFDLGFELMNNLKPKTKHQ
ncbi:serine hydrolase domain-containing protein [Robertkochia sediminum]|uniref:serine hydrolase domain-containing protein n=1 Tax=Robertkochia sediminum TaxID=2785326 RepID=UPI0019321163|nr:serine hydrolase domain-containing protein [Robertkochia sediminum]MBL7471519.1 beta-lactamase family protein [Robertkochia sediminum]